FHGFDFEEDAVKNIMSCLLSFIAVIAAVPAWAQAYPSRPIRMIVPFPPGGQTDIHGRLVAKLMEDRLSGTQVIVENRPGAGGMLGTAALANSPPDGYTIGCIVPSTASRAFHKSP